MAKAEQTDEVTAYCTEGYSGSIYEGKGPPTERPEDAHPDVVASEIGLTYPTLVYAGDGVTLHPTSPGQPPPPDHLPPEEEGKTGDETVSYEDFTVVELKNMAAKRGVDIKSDWNKTEIIEALEGADNG